MSKPTCTPYSPSPTATPAHWLGHLPILAGCLVVAATIGWILVRVWDGLFIPWWFNTDELVFYYEVIRQLRLDPSQTFFDIPGTPFMALTSAITLVWWLTAHLFGLTQSATPSDFAFEHIQGVYTLMRAMTLGFFAMAVALSFDLFRRTAGVLAATVASLLIATLPIHVHYSHFVRTESLGLVLTLAAVWLVAHSRSRSLPRTYLIAALLTGVAIGARFHFAMVGPPVLLAIFWLRDRKAMDERSKPDSHGRLWQGGILLAALFVAGVILTLLFKIGVLNPGWLTHTMLLSTASGAAQFADAKATVAKLWLLLGTTSATLLALGFFERTRRWIRPILNPWTLALAIGVAAGFLISHPAFLWRGEHQLRSIQYYSDWVDPQLQALGAFGSWWNVTRYYFTTALPEGWAQVAFFLGSALLLFRAPVLWIAFGFGAGMCFVAHPITMKLWPHHIIPWLPFLCFVVAIPFATIERIGTRWRRWPSVAAFAVLVCGGLSLWGVADRLGHTQDYLQTSRARTEQIAEMNAWLAQNVPSDAYLVISYYSLADDGFFKWIENAGVRVPDQVKRHRDVRIWWLERSAIDGRNGYICISRADIAFFRDDFERRKPGSTYNPFTDPGFEPVAKFGGGFYELEVFKFDFRSSPQR